MKEFDVQALLWRHFTKNHMYMMYNIFHFYGDLNVELDYLLIDLDGYSTEFEIKVNRKDFTDEFLSKTKKHELLKSRDPSCPNKYLFIAPEGVAKLEDIPEYAGFVELILQKDGTYKYKTWRKPQFLHKEKINPNELFPKLYYRYFADQQLKFNNDRKRITKSKTTPPKVSRRKSVRRRRR